MQMGEKRALLMENFFPQPDGLVMRDGNTAHVTDFTQPVERLHVHAATNGGESLWGTTVNGIYDCTIAGTMPAVSMALTNGKTISSSIATGAGNYLMLVNGTDTLKQYDGTSWTSVPTFGGTATSIYSYVETYRQRLFFVKRNSLEIEYLAANSISGTATNYPLGALFRLGGYIVALGTWTVDGGVGPEDSLAAVSNKGEVVIYSGADPATWSLKGVYFIGRPLGETPMFKYGGDLLVLTENGVFPLSSAIQSTAIDRQKAVTGDIKPVLTRAAQSFRVNQGWQIISNPAVPYLMVNIPSTPVRKQAVMHAQTGAWTLFSGWEALYFARVANEMYFSTNNGVYRVNGFNDNGANITGKFIQASSRLGYNTNKKIEIVRPFLNSNGGFTYSLGISCNFVNPKELSQITPHPESTPSDWGSGLFGEAIWGGDIGITQDWVSTGDEYSLWKAIYFKVVTNSSRIFYYGSDLAFNVGGKF